ncbi:MAG: hypothetical protein A3I05_06555 [Deltaproteobacteria bacterium RIFCSPLOWO2_02_FULL_44_10]|nr:MAG: hypothetical protein A3C46_06760 [Deltaproteobacteria bacterium RIFCSPHIGHO2_02_FULL_44_16]OGQ46695.1 MAG: hypothetical protein A3I05_06555 [Deltaproteobacteria bacterium RIFCSPLOWO2_02_FULL_44_10]
MARNMDHQNEPQQHDDSMKKKFLFAIAFAVLLGVYIAPISRDNAPLAWDTGPILNNDAPVVAHDYGPILEPYAPVVAKSCAVPSDGQDNWGYTRTWQDPVDREQDVVTGVYI